MHETSRPKWTLLAARTKCLIDIFTSVALWGTLFETVLCRSFRGCKTGEFGTKGGKESYFIS